MRSVEHEPCRRNARGFGERCTALKQAPISSGSAGVSLNRRWPARGLVFCWKRAGTPIAMGQCMALLAMALVLGVGVSLGLLGGGGSILMVPILRYALGQDAHTAITLSLLVVGTTSLAAVVPHARAGRVRWKTAFV